MSQHADPRVLAVVPARYASTRFPGKIIASLAGKPLVMHAYDRARRAKRVSEVIIAADDPRVVAAVEPLGARVVTTRPDHPTGTDRIAEVAAEHMADIVVNVQGDEALIEPHTIDATIRALVEDPGAAMATARHRLTDPARIQDPNVVKVVCDAAGRALYFSRSPIPYIRDAADRTEWGGEAYWQHIGIYAYRWDFLLAFTQLPRTPLERLENLEQLRALEHGHGIAVIETEYDGVGVDVPEDLAYVRRRLEGAAQGRGDEE